MWCVYVCVCVCVCKANTADKDNMRVCVFKVIVLQYVYIGTFLAARTTRGLFQVYVKRGGPYRL